MQESADGATDGTACVCVADLDQQLEDLAVHQRGLHQSAQSVAHYYGGLLQQSLLLADRSTGQRIGL